MSSATVVVLSVAVQGVLRGFVVSGRVVEGEASSLFLVGRSRSSRTRGRTSSSSSLFRCPSSGPRCPSSGTVCCPCCPVSVGSLRPHHRWRGSCLARPRERCESFTSSPVLVRGFGTCGGSSRRLICPDLVFPAGGGEVKLRIVSSYLDTPFCLRCSSFDRDEWCGGWRPWCRL